MKRILSVTLSAAALSAAACGSGETTCNPEAPGTICTIVGNGLQGFSGDNGPATGAALYVPQDTAISPDGELWVLDFNNYLIRAVDSKGFIRSVVGTGLLGDSPMPGETSVAANKAYFNHTTDLFFHDGYLYLAAWHNSRVKRVNLSTMQLENYAGIGRRTLYTGDEGPALMAALDLPSSIALAPDGGIVVMDQANQVIRKIDADGNIHRIAGRCVIDEVEQCAEPVLCANSNKFVCGDPATECEKACKPSYGGDDGDALMARMAQPFGQMADPAGRIAYDLTGNLVFADTDNNRIRKVDTNGMISTIAGTGEAGYSGDGGPGKEAKINHPVDVAADDNGDIYFTDVANNCVRKIDTSGIIQTVVGQCGPKVADRGFEGDGGPPLKAKLNRPYGIDIVGRKLYVSDSYNNRIRVVNLD